MSYLILVNVGQIQILNQSIRLMGQKCKLNKKQLIDRIWKNTNTNYERKDTKQTFISTLVTQSSPDPKQLNQIVQFFNNFHHKCSIIYKSVRYQQRQPVFRNIKPQLIKHTVNNRIPSSQQQYCPKDKIQEMGQKQYNKSVRMATNQSEQKIKQIKKQLKQVYNSHKLPIYLNGNKSELRRCGSQYRI